MAISQGDKLPDAVLRRMGDNGPEEITIEALTAGRKIILFGLPGAFTPTCSSAHVPSFIRTRDAFLEKGIEEIICVSVNDVHIMRQWGEATGATAACLSMWADPASEFTTAIGMNFDVEVLGSRASMWPRSAAAAHSRPPPACDCACLCVCDHRTPPAPSHAQCCNRPL